jgi:hypothetical protein
MRWAGLVREPRATEDVAGVLSKNERRTLLRLLKKLGKHAAEIRKKTDSEGAMVTLIV